MMLTRRRLMKLGAGLAGSAFTAGVLPRLVREARGQPQPDGLRFVLLTDGNGWNHQGGGRNSTTLDTTVRSETDWDLPEVLQAFAPFRERVSINRPLYQPFGTNLHGAGWGTTTCVRPRDGGPGGVSIDRLIGRAIGGNDVFPSIAFGMPRGRDRAPICLSADGPNTPFSAIGPAEVGHAVLFGSGGQGTTIETELELLDGVREDVNRTRQRLAGPERIKLDQLLSSYEAVAQELRRKQQILSGTDLPPVPDGSGTRANIEAQVDLIGQAFAFGLTHVAHLSIHGKDAHNAGWGFLGNEHGGDAHEQVAHVTDGFNRERSDATYRAQIQFKAGLIARLYAQLDAIPIGESTMARDTVFVWINSGGGKHHNGAAYTPVLTIGDARGRLQAGRFVEHGDRPAMNAAYLAIAQAMGVQTDAFGEPPADWQDPLSTLLA